MPEKEEIQVHDEEQRATETKPKQRKRRRKRMLTGISKQRRLANERERKRLQVVNTAFVSLKNALPLSSVDQKISRIEIVRLASRHIASLMQLLQHGEDLEGVENEHFCCEDQIISDDELIDNHGDSDGCDGPDNLNL
ncbi:transcription factor 15-like [Paramuricea clavata]|uniref:Transcription factor 15-like n=1 Tax=Paramuricea clavata TaxID=317549 RepID=A0A7D9HHN4_PARCT|nr:transcription factor 15-like [Paramuricea clavata]